MKKVLNEYKLFFYVGVDMYDFILFLLVGLNCV